MRYLFMLFAVLLITSSLNAQISFGINFNVDQQPIWGPTGNDYVENYYLPDIDVYYNVPLHRFYYNEGGRWIYRSSLPSRYHNFDLYNSYKVVVNDKNPWRNHEKYRDQYSSYKGRHDQQPIRDSRDSKYFVNKNHPEHNNWAKQQRQGNGRNNVIQQRNNNNRSGVMEQRNNNGRNKAVQQNNRGNKQENNKGNKQNNNKGNKDNNRK